MAPTNPSLPLFVPSSPTLSTSDGSSTSPRSVTSRASETTSTSSAPLVTHAAAPAGVPPQSSQYARIRRHGQVPTDEGWPLLAQLMVKKPDFEAFSRYRDLNVKNLLYYQVELDQLRRRLQEKERRDYISNPNGGFAKFAENMISTPPSAQWNQIKDLRRLLHEYNEALLLYSQVSALPEPNSDNMKQLHAWLTNTMCGNCCINGAGSDAWGKLYERTPPTLSLSQLIIKALNPFKKPPRDSRTVANLVAPHPAHAVDGLTRWIEDDLVPIWHHLFPPPKDGSDGGGAGDVPSSTEKNLGPEEKEDPRIALVKCYPQSRILKITSRLSTVVACLLPTIAIGVLTTAETTLQKLLYIGGFTALFSVGLMTLTTEASRVQIFTATAAFSAVLVVFVQNQ